MKNLINTRRKYLVTDSERARNFKIGLGIFGAIILLVIVINGAKYAASTKPVENTVDYVANVTNEEIDTEIVETDTETEDIIEIKEPTDNTAAPSVLSNNIPEQYYVTKIVDGDTIYVSGIDTRIRLIGINTPETVSSSTPVQCYGPEASHYLENLILGKYVGLESDPAAGDLDRYNRPLRYVYYNGENVNYNIIYNGYGYEASYGSDYKYSDQFISAEQDAKENLRGLWSPNTCNGEL